MTDHAFANAILVTGASTGIGRAAAITLARAGFIAYAGIRKPADANALSAEATRLNLSSHLLPLTIDVADPHSISAAASHLRTRHPAGLAGLVNNAGIIYSGPVEALPLADWRHQFEVNLFGLVAITQALLPQIRPAKGRIINITSIGGRIAFPYIGAYNASKFAAEALTDALRVELAPQGIKVVSILPGAIKTEIFGKGTSQLRTLMQQLTTDQHTVYDAPLERAYAAWKSVESKGITPDVVARTILTAMTHPHPKTRYLVGTDARIQSLMKAWLPDRWLDIVTRRFLGLHRLPTPALPNPQPF